MTWSSQHAQHHYYSPFSWGWRKFYIHSTRTPRYSTLVILRRFREPIMSTCRSRTLTVKPERPNYLCDPRFKSWSKYSDLDLQTPTFLSYAFWSIHYKQFYSNMDLREWPLWSCVLLILMRLLRNFLLSGQPGSQWVTRDRVPSRWRVIKIALCTCLSTELVAGSKIMECLTG